ncbi:MAG: signal peptidase I [Clostridia bacterium]|nr:signal peptidase I [Clostridia bacterium]
MKKLTREIYELMDSVVIALVAVMLIFTLVCRVYVVDGGSMKETLQDHDRVLVSNIFYTPEQGDIICFVAKNHNDQVLVKRVIATAGQTIDLNSAHQVVIDGKVLDESYLDEYVSTPNGTVKNETYANGFSFPYTVKEGEVFCMGDNRTGSLDSRSLGTIETKYILGKMLVRLFPNTGVVE